VSNVVGNTTVTNINLVQSALTLTMTPVSDDSQLWQPTVSVGGNISDSSDAVWVNGVAGVNNGNGTWNADNVPTTSGGVATFDVTAYPPSEAPSGSLSGSGVNPQTANAANTGASPDKPVRLYVASYTESKTQNSDDAYDGYYDSDGNIIQYITYNDDWNDSMGWFDQQGGNSESLDTFSTTADWPGVDNGDGWDQQTYSWPASAWPALAEGSWQEESDSEDFNTGETDPWYGTNTAEPPDILFEHCSLNGELIASQWNGSENGGGQEMRHHLTFHRTAQTVMKLQTGGKATSQRQNLFVLSASAQSGELQLWPWWEANLFLSDFEATNPVDPTQITIDGLPLDSSGNIANYNNIYIYWR
jgi:hypothetical protein